MLDGLEGWQILALVAPVAVTMHWIRMRELRAASTPYEALSEFQKVWILSLALTPAAAARLLALLSPEEREACLEQGARIRGDGRLVVGPVLREYARAAPALEKIRNQEELAARISRLVEDDLEVAQEKLYAAWGLGFAGEETEETPPPSATEGGVEAGPLSRGLEA